MSTGNKNLRKLRQSCIEVAPLLQGLTLATKAKELIVCHEEHKWYNNHEHKRVNTQKCRKK